MKNLLCYAWKEIVWLSSSAFVQMVEEVMQYSGTSERAAACAPTSGFKSQCLYTRTSAGRQFWETQARNLRGGKEIIQVILSENRLHSLLELVLHRHPGGCRQLGCRGRTGIRPACRRVRHRGDRGDGDSRSAPAGLRGSAGVARSAASAGCLAIKLPPTPHPPPSPGSPQSKVRGRPWGSRRHQRPPRAAAGTAVTRAPTWPGRTLPSTCRRAAPARGGGGRRGERGRGRGPPLATAQGCGLAPPPPRGAAVGRWAGRAPSSRSRTGGERGRYLRLTGRRPRGSGWRVPPRNGRRAAGWLPGWSAQEAPGEGLPRGRCLSSADGRCGPRRPSPAPKRLSVHTAGKTPPRGGGSAGGFRAHPEPGTASLGTPGRAGRPVTRINRGLAAPCGLCGSMVFWGNWICLCPFKHSPPPPSRA